MHAHNQCLNCFSMYRPLASISMYIPALRIFRSHGSSLTPKSATEIGLKPSSQRSEHVQMLELCRTCVATMPSMVCLPAPTGNCWLSSYERPGSLTDLWCPIAEQWVTSTIVTTLPDQTLRQLNFVLRQVVTGIVVGNFVIVYYRSRSQTLQISDTESIIWQRGRKRNIHHYYNITAVAHAQGHDLYV